MNGQRSLRMGLGPVFRFEWIVASRRWQAYALRSLFVAMLLAALLVIWWGWIAPKERSVGAITFQELAKVGEVFYLAVIGTQLTLVLLVAPAATAGSICIDRARGTMTHVLVTDLSGTEIVLGKLAARLVPVLGLVACTLPVMALLTLLGGVDPDALFGAFLVTIGIAVLGCALALVFSLWSKKTHEALLATYTVWGLWLLGRPMAGLYSSSTGWAIPGPPKSADPFALAFAPYWYPGSVALGDYLGFLGVTCGIAAVLAIVAVWRLRPVCTRVTVRKTRDIRSRTLRVLAGVDLTRFLPRPSLNFNPVLWREWHRGQQSGGSKALIGLFFVLAGTSSVCAIFASGRGRVAPAFVNGFQVSIGLLMLSVTAATSLAEERVRGSLDLLMATRLSTTEIVIGKWLGALRLVPWLAVLPSVVVLCIAESHLDGYVAAGATFLFVLASGAAVASLGIALATWCSRLSRAVALTVTIYVAVTVGWVFIVVSLTSGPASGGDVLVIGSPFFAACFIAADLCRPAGSRDLEHVPAVIFWTFLYAGVAVVFLSAALTTFNRCLGRVERGLPMLGRYAVRPRKPVLANEFDLA